MRAFFQELVRRRVFSTLAAYAVGSWVVVEVASVILPTFDAPDEALKYLIIVLATLCPLVILLAWFYDITLKGVVLTHDESSGAGIHQATRELPETAEPESGGVLPAPEDVEEAANKAGAESGEEPLEEPPPEPPKPIEVDAERRLITVLQYSIDPIAAADQEIDEELVRDQLPALYREFAAIVEHYEGFVAKTEGELILAYFGVDVVHEDDTIRACLSAVDMVSRLERFNSAGESNIKLGASIGLHCGFAIVEPVPGASVDQWISNVGPVLRAVAALQVQAEGNEILVSEAARMMLHGSIQCEGTHQIRLPGGRQTEQVYRVSRERQTDTAPLDRRELIGRGKELLFLQECWNSTRESEGQAVLLRGEAGIGKSMLVQELCAEVDPDTAVLQLQCSAYHVNSSLYPVVQYMQDVVLEFTTADSIDQKVGKLRAFLEEHYSDVDDLMPVFGVILSIDAGIAPIDLVPERQKEVLFDAILRYVLQQARQHSLLIVIEDLHWADPTMMELISMLVDHAATERLMLLLTYRPSLETPWGDASHITRLNVGRLNDDYALKLIRGIDKGNFISDELAASIVAKSDGVPLFIEQYTEMVLDSLAKELNEIDLSIPSTLQESLAARLQHLGGAKTVLNQCAVMGREFSRRLLLACTDFSTAELDEHLAELMDCELIRQRGMGDDREYFFKHALIQEAAYQSMLKSKREEYHQRVAEQAEQLKLTTVEEQPEVMARHYGSAAPTETNVSRAIGYWLKAAGVAIKRSANQEAYTIVANARELLGKLSESDVRNHCELQIEVTRIPILVAQQGYASAEMAQASERALLLCQSTEDMQLKFIAMYSICVFSIVSGKHDQSFQTATLLQQMCQSDKSLQVESYMLLGITNFFLGAMIEARNNFDKVLEIYDRAEHGDHAFLYGQDPEILSLAYLLWTHYSLGNFHLLPDIEQMLHERAASLNHPTSSSFCHIFSGWFRFNMGDHAAPAQDIADALAITEEYRLGNFYNQCQVLNTLNQYFLSPSADKVSAAQGAFRDFRADGSRCFLVCWESYLADACIDANLLDEAGALLDTVQQELAQTKERWGESQLQCSLGRLALARGEAANAVAHWQRGLDLAQARGLRGWGLWNAVELAKYQKTAEPEAARGVLANALDALAPEARQQLPPAIAELAAELDIA